MQNIDVRFNASSNFNKVKADLSALEAQAASLGAVFSQNAYAKPPALVDPTSWQKSTRAVHEASNAYRNAVSSSGLLTSQQIRATAEAERYTRALQKQKLTWGEMRKNSGIMKQVYEDQLRYQRMTAQYWGTDSAGRAITDITIPNNVPRGLDTVAQKMYFLGEGAKSAGTQVINLGKNMQWAGRQLMVGFTYPVALFGAAAGVMAYKVDEAMTQVTKVYDVSAAAMKDESLRTKELNDVRLRSFETASQAATKYGQSIENTLGVEAALASSGLSGDKLFESTDAVSRIATLGDLDLTASTDMTIALQTAFKDTIKTSEDLTNSFNFMNAVENATSLTIRDIAEATPRAASAMSALGVNVEEMTVLLTSMREAGVDAAEGANALKSATGTILSPSPAALEFIKGIGGPKMAEGIANLRKTTGGNLYKAIKEIYDLTESLSSSDRQAIIVKLFGKYQFNRVSAMVENLGSAFENTQNQTRKAMDLMAVDSKELGELAERELGEKMEAVSGKFKAAWQAMRAELSKTGMPFLEVATRFAEAGTDALKFFNNMDDWKKKAALVVAGIMAIVGPAVMLGGLFLNLGGQFTAGSGKILTGLGRLGGAFRLVSKEEQAAALSAEAQNKALGRQVPTTASLAQEIAILTAAYQKATIAARAYAETQGVVASTQASGMRPGPSPVPLGPQLPAAVSGPVSYPKGANEWQKNNARNKALREAQMTELKRQQTQVAITKAAEKEALTREKIEKSMSGAVLGAAALSASMLLMTATSNETANNIGKWLMIGSIAAPAMQGLVGAGNNLVSSLGKSVGNVKALAGGVGGVGGAMKVATAGAVGFGRALNAALGPIGWITLGLTAAVGVFMAIKKHNDDIRKKQAAVVREQVEATKKMQTSTASIATNLGKAAGSYKQITRTTGTAFTGEGSQSQMLQSYNYYKSDEGREEVKALQSDGRLVDTDELMDKIRGKFIDLQVLGSDTAEQAKTDIQAMLVAAGASASQAAEMAREVYEEYGSVNKIDWAKPISDQAAALDSLAREAFKTKTDMVSGRGGAAYGISFEVDENAKSQLYAQATKSSEIFNQALATANSPAAARKIIDQYMEAATSQWQAGWGSLIDTTESGGDALRDLFNQYGIDSGAALADAMRNNPAFEDAYLDMARDPKVAVQLREQLVHVREFATQYEHAFISPLSKSSWYLSDSILTAVSAMKQFAEAGVGLNADEATRNLMDNNEEFKEYVALRQKMDALSLRGVPDNSKLMLDLQNQLNEKSKALLPIVNRLNAEFNFRKGKNASEALRNLLGKIAAEGKKAETGVKGVKKAVENIPERKTVTIQINQVGGIVQSAMSAVQSRMSDSAMTSFNDRWDASMSAAQSSWDSRMDAMTASHDAAQNAMDNRQQAAQDAFDRRWEARKEALEKEYQRKIDRVKREIEAEQKADKIRQDLFEKEKARLAALAERDNTNIDFNTQLDTGKLDEAAKTLNNAGAASANAQMDAEQKAAEARTAARIAALEKKNERLEKARDKELKNLQVLEDRMRKHLERVQDARRRALEKQQADEVKALEKSEEAAMKSMEKQRNYEEAMLQQRLELFKAYTARNQRDLERWMKEVGLSYDDFGADVKAKGERWSTYFRKELSEQIRQAGTEVMNDNIWEKVGKGMANKLLKGLGFNNLAQFNNFVRTGTKSGGKGGKSNNDVETRHEGGMIGSGMGSRGNIPNTYKGLHRTEKMVRAQKGEYMINRGAAREHLPLLEAINKGADIPMPGVGGIAGGDGGGLGSNGYGGPAALMAAAVTKMFAKGTEKAFQNAYQVGLSKQRALSGPGGKFAGAAGTYGGRTFSAAQMKNAAIIASVGSSMGMSNRDIMIGIMTAIAESGLVNVNYGDRDSLGLFQQRPSMGWGTPAQVTDPRYASRAFFGPLKAHGERVGETPWLAAQHIQRSAFADGSNYRVWWEAAQQIFKQGLTKKAKPGGGGGFVPGSGGRHRPISGPVTNGLHGGNSFGNPPAVDMAGPSGRPVYAVADGRIVTSRDISGPLSTDSYNGDGPYGSFGRYIQLQTDSGAGVLYAHLSRRSVSAGQRVTGGSVIGYSGNTGNSSGPHLHFGATNGPYAWLRKGGEIKYDNTHVVAHRGETMLSAPVTRQLKENIASGGNSDYNVTIDLRGAYIKEDVDIEKAVNVAIDRRETKVGRKRVVR